MATEAMQAPIAITLESPIYDGMHVSFYSAGGSEEVSHLQINHPDENGVFTRTTFYLVDSNGADVSGVFGAFSVGQVVHVILDVSYNLAYVQNAAFNSTVQNAIKNSDANEKSWKTVVFIPYDGNVHTLAEGPVDVLLELPEVIDLTLYNYEFEVIAFGLTVTGATAYNTNLPNISLCQDTYKNRLTISLPNTEEMEDGAIPECDAFGFYLKQGWLTAGQMKFIESGNYYSYTANSMKTGFCTGRGHSDVSESYYNFIWLTTYASNNTHTYGLMFRYRPIIEG